MAYPGIVSVRLELAQFLANRRGRLRPSDVGLDNGRRRRVPGLRREEVAVLANVSEAWYSRLEAGHDIKASRDVLDAIARALRLDDDERAYLFALAGASEPPLPRVDLHPQVPLAVRETLDALEFSPAVVYGPRWDVLAQNRAYVAVFGDIFDVPVAFGNVVRQVFLDPTRRALFVDWEGVARALLQTFRVSAGRYADDPSFVELIRDLRDESTEFRMWWDEHDVERTTMGEKLIEHPRAGTLLLDHVAFALPDFPDVNVIVYTPNRSSAAKVRELCTMLPGGFEA